MKFANSPLNPARFALQGAAGTTIADDDLKFFRVTQIAYLVGLFGHAMAIFGFADQGVTEMAWFNALISVPLFLVALMLNRRGRHNLAFSLAFFELFTHQLICTYFVGWGFGMQYWLFYLGGLCFFNPHWSAVVRYTMFVVVSAGLVGLYLFAQVGVYMLPPDILQARSISNLVIPLAVLGLLINYYSRSALSAEQRLQHEKAITEQQNQLLSKQHDELAAEQNKTSQLLDKIQSLFGQQVSEEVANELIHNPADFESKSYEVSVMFVDIRDFTVFADSREPADVARFQNVVFGELIDIVRQQHGVVLQILGDGILAVFGAPVVRQDHAANALRAGRAMLNRIDQLGREQLIPKIRLGIGIHSGQVIAGNVGNESRRFYSLTGKTVIIAARIEQLNKEYQSQFLASEATVLAAGTSAGAVDQLGPVPLKGIEQPIEVFRLD